LWPGRGQSTGPAVSAAAISCLEFVACALTLFVVKLTCYCPLPARAVPLVLRRQRRQVVWLWRYGEEQWFVVTAHGTAVLWWFAGFDWAWDGYPY
jgi:hypothetical protein